MKTAIFLISLFASVTMNSQTIWRSVGADDFNQASYGITNRANDAIRNNRLIAKNGKVYLMNLELGSGNKKWFAMGKFSNGHWEHMKTPFWITSSDQTAQFSFEVDNNEVPYLFFNDPLNGNKATVKIFDGMSWVDLGGTAVSNSSSTVLEMTLGNDNLPFILFKEGNVTKVKKFDGTSWVSIPASDLEGLSSAVVKLDHNNVPYVLYGGFLKKFNGVGWSEVGITGFTYAGTSMCIDSLNQPYIVNANVIRKFNGVSWQTLPTIPSYYNDNTLSITLDADDNLYAAYTTSGLLYKSIRKLVNGSWQTWGGESSYGPMSISIDGNTVYEQHTKTTNFPVVKKKVGLVWEMLGDESTMLDAYTSSSSQQYKYNDMTIHNGIPTIAYKNNFYGKLSVKEFTIGGSWNNVGGEIISEESISNAKIETDSNGNTYVAYLNVFQNASSIINSLVTVKKRVGNNWELVGPLNFSQTAETKMDFKINHQNVPYVVYKSGRVQKYNGTLWEFVGDSAFTGEKDVQLTFDNNDQSYIIYMGSTGPVVKRFNGTSWEEIGTGSLTSFTNATLPRIICDAGNNIIISFQDASKKIHVYTWNGTAWVALGSEINTEIAAFGESFLSLAIDNNNVPYLFFNHLYNNFRKMANVYKFSGIDWLPLGNTDFSPGEVTEGNILFTADNTPVVSYSSLNGIYCRYFGEQDALLDTEDFQIIDNNNVIISPNPVTSIFSVKSDTKIEEIEILDLTGKKVFSSKEIEEINISSLQSGLYIIKVKTDNRIYSEKIFKN